MKLYTYFGVAIITILIFILGMHTGNTQNSVAFGDPGYVRVRAVDFKTKTEGLNIGDRSVYAQFLLDSTGKKIGNSYIICTSVGESGILGKGVLECHGIYNLPLGKITIQGSRSSKRDKLTFVVTGGTGIYEGVGGILNGFIIGTSPHRERLIFRIE